MKKILFIAAAMCLVSCKHIEQTNADPTEKNEGISTNSLLEFKKKFHIEVRHCDWYGGHYQIFFTNNDWITEDVYMEWYSNLKLDNEGLFSKKEAIRIAKKLDTYEKCLNHNKMVEDKVRQTKAEKDPIQIY